MCPETVGDTWEYWDGDNVTFMKAGMGLTIKCISQEISSPPVLVASQKIKTSQEMPRLLHTSSVTNVNVTSGMTFNSH